MTERLGAGGRRRAGGLLIVILVVLARQAGAGDPSDSPEQSAEPPLRDLYAPGEEYRTPRAGEGFRAHVLGRDVVVPPRDRRTISAWDLGMASVAPGVPGQEVLPFASLFFWRQPDERTFLRVVGVGVYDDIFFAKAAESTRPIEGVLSFENYTVPVPQDEYLDGHRVEDEEVLWGQVRGGVGIGYRNVIPRPGRNDNMAAVSLLAEPGYLYFHDGPDADPAFEEPQDTFETRIHLKMRFDLLERNLFELPHRGYVLGSDVIQGFRANWEDWGIDRSRDASGSREYQALSAYVAGAGGVPFVESDRHRLVGSVHGGWGDGLDRFSRFRIGGGPSGYEFESISRAVMPGAFIQEFQTNRYAVAIGEYRYEAIFFTYLSIRSSVSYIRRERLRGEERIWSDDVLASIGGRVTTGFLFETLLQLDYNYNFGVLRRGDYGGNEVTFHVSKSF